MTCSLSLAGRAVACLVFSAGAFALGQFGPGRGLAQAEDSDAPPPRRPQPQPGGSDVFDGTDKSIGTLKPPRRAKPEPSTPPRTGRVKPEPEAGEDADDEEPMGVDAPPESGSSEGAPEPEPAEPVALPDKAAQAKALKLVKEVFAEEYRKKSVEDKLALAAQLLEQARGSGNDAATQYVMLREARDIAAAGGDLGTALSAVDEIAAVFADVDAIAMKLEALAAASR